MKVFPKLLFSIFLLLLPTQLGVHFWPDFSLVAGRRIDYLSPTLYLTDIVLAFWAIAALPHIKMKPRDILLISCFSLLFVVSWVLPATRPLLALYGTARLVQFLVVVWLVKKAKPELKQIVLPLTGALAYTCFLAVGQFLQQESLQSIWYFFGERRFSLATPGIALIEVQGRQLLRAYASFSHPNVLAGFAATLMPLFLFFKPARGWQYVCRRIGVVLLVAITFLSFSRVAWFAVVAVGLYYFVFKKSPRFTFISFGVVALLLVVEELVVGRFLGLTTDALSINERNLLFLNAWQLFWQQPFIGIGLLHFIPHLPDVTRPPYLLQPVHSIYALAAVETGLMGMGLLLGAALSLARKHTLLPRWLQLSLFVVGFCGLFDHYFITQVQTRLLLAILLGLVI